MGFSPGASLSRVPWARCPGRRAARPPSPGSTALFVRHCLTKKIRLVQDSLNTHDASSLYESFPPAEVSALAQRFEFFYTPKAASWLNMIET